MDASKGSLVTNAKLLIDLVKDGQKLVADARNQRTEDYGSRCAGWAAIVKTALQDDPLALARFEQAAPLNDDESGIPYGFLRDRQMTRARLAVLIDIARERQRQKWDDILTLKPSMWGMGIDLKAAWHRWRAMIDRWRQN